MERDLADRLLRSFISELDEQVRAMNTELLELEAEPADGERIRSLFRIAHTVKGAARVVGVQAVEGACHDLETIFSRVREELLDLEPAHFRLFFAVADALGDASGRLARNETLEGGPLRDLLPHLAATAAGKHLDPAALPPVNLHTGDEAPFARRPSSSSASFDGSGEEAHVRLRPERLDSLLAASGALRVGSARLRDRPREARALHDLAHGWAAEWRRSSVRLRELLEEAGVDGGGVELVRSMENELREIVGGLGDLARRIREDQRVVERIVEEIGGAVHALRMRPFADACEALPRAVRDVARASGKEARLVVEGQGVEVDRAVIDALREPLLHLVRNAVDHGIETPEERAAAGKPREGQIHVSAVLGAGRLQLRVADDGAGMNVPALREQLARRGRPVPEHDEDVVRGLFRGGLSTREEATEISGRGVGLELVQWWMDRLGGSVDVRWAAGRGTTFQLDCPRSTATVRALITEVDSDLLALPTAHVERVMRILPQDLRRSEGGLLLPTEETPLPVRSLAGLLGPPFEGRTLSRHAPLVVLRAGQRRLGVLVDGVLEETEIVVRPLPGEPVSVAYVTGGALLPDGRVAPVLNAAELVAAGTSRESPREPIALAPPDVRVPATILVVDDSITTRTLEQSVLEAAGYGVRTAADGEAGWRLLQEERADLVVADVEMPRLDGIALCERIRRSPDHRDLPVVLVTALETPEDRERGLDAGADAYLLKSSFDQEALLATIRELID